MSSNGFLLLSSILSGTLGVIAGAVISVVYQTKHYKGNLVEKWMSDLRNEIAHFLELAESMRLMNTEMIPANKDIFSQIHSKSQKIKLLLNDEFKQRKIFEHVQSMVQEASKRNPDWSKYSMHEVELVKFTKDVLGEEWTEVYKTPKAPIVAIFIFLIGLPVFIYIYAEEITKLVLK
ncbi:hypothetical protein [Desulfonatronum thiodismutans]|uniref:hypothetical protein n=1 Tax=Desulfonatronum thiodismutans TaxID=159290 RepID=UPI0004ABDF1C|nr:hypothetical protein [Desulfonatronum thiodismutans]